MINIGDPDGVPRLVGLHFRPLVVSEILIPRNRLLASALLRDTNGILVRIQYAERSIHETEANVTPEIFLPSYVECDFESLERKRDPVHEIRLSEEEIKQMIPQ